MTYDEYANWLARYVYSWKRAKKLERKRNPKLKFNALYDMLKHPDKYKDTKIRIRMPRDYHP